MTDDELRDAYRQATSAYEDAKAGNGDRTIAFVKFLSAEQALASRFGPEVYSMFCVSSIAA